MSMSRVSMLRRWFNARTLAATAVTFGSPNGRSPSAIAEASSTVSESTVTTMSELVRANA